MNNKSILVIPAININYSDQISSDIIGEFYQLEELQTTLATTLSDMVARLNSGLTFPYFQALNHDDFISNSNKDSNNDTPAEKPIELDIYITDPTEGRELNHEARGKDYATNILSYPSDLPAEILSILPSISLGELVICHDVVVSQATEQGKTVKDHLHHLLVHGTLHLLGFDHELGEAERMEMEGFEINILSQLNIQNPYDPYE